MTPRRPSSCPGIDATLIPGHDVRGLPIDAVAMQGGDDARLAEHANVHGPVHAHPRHMRSRAPLRRMGPHPGLLHLGLPPDSRHPADARRISVSRRISASSRSPRRTWRSQIWAPGRVDRACRLDSLGGLLDRLRVAARQRQAARSSGLSACGHQNHRCNQNNLTHVTSPVVGSTRRLVRFGARLM